MPEDKPFSDAQARQQYSQLVFDHIHSHFDEGDYPLVMEAAQRTLTALQRGNASLPGLRLVPIPNEDITNACKATGEPYVADTAIIWPSSLADDLESLQQAFDDAMAQKD